MEVLNVFLRLMTSLKLLDCCDPRPTALKMDPTILLLVVSVVLDIVLASMSSICERMCDIVVALLTSISRIGLVGEDDIFFQMTFIPFHKYVVLSLSISILDILIRT